MFLFFIPKVYRWGVGLNNSKIIFNWHLWTITYHGSFSYSVSPLLLIPPTFLALAKPLDPSPQRLLLSLKFLAYLILITSVPLHFLSQAFQRAFLIVDVDATDARRRRNTNAIFATICHRSGKLSKLNFVIKIRGKIRSLKSSPLDILKVKNGNK